MYNKIINPITRRKVNIYGKLGRKILSKYIHLLFGGGGDDTPEPSPVRTESDIPEPDSQESVEYNPASKGVADNQSFQTQTIKEEEVTSKNSNMAIKKTTSVGPRQSKPKNSNSGK